MCGFIAEVKDKLDIVMDELNLGGGFGIKYTEKDDPVAYDQYIDAVASVIKTCCWEAGIKLPKILMEPGRSIVASAGITLYLSLIHIWILENQAGRPNFIATRRQQAEHQLETVGKELRHMMSWAKK